MLSASATLVETITQYARRPFANVQIAWKDVGGSLFSLDGSIASVMVDRNIRSDIPADANLVTGPAASEATIKLNGLIEQRYFPASLLSPYTSTIVTPRVAVNMDVDLGFITSLGKEFVNSFKGRVRSVTTLDDKTATVTGLDGPEQLRTTVTLPTFAASDPGNLALWPGLDNGWVMDYILRKNGYYRSNPPRPTGEVFCATNFGSLWPEKGTLLSSYRRNMDTGGPQGAAFFTTLTWIDGVTRNRGLRVERDSLTDPVQEATYALDGTLSVNDGSNIFVEMSEIRITRPDTYEMNLINLYNNGGGSGLRIDQLASGQIRVTVFRQGASGSVDLGLTPLGAVTYIAVHAAMTSTGANIHLKVRNKEYSLPATDAETTGTIAVGNSTGNPAIDRMNVNYQNANYGVIPPTVSEPFVQVNAGFTLGQVQVSNEAYSSIMYVDAWVPEAVIDEPKNTLIVTPSVEERAPWSLLQEIAVAECGVILFDEAGIVRFYNRDRMTVTRTADVLVSSKVNLKAISAEQSIDTVRNVVRVPANPYQIDLTSTIIWELSETLRIPASGSIDIAADLPGVAINVITGFGASTAGVPFADDLGGNRYRAAQNSDGTGGNVTNLSVSITKFPSRLTIHVSNPNAFDVWLVGNTVYPSEQGNPSLHVMGRLARLTEFQYRATARDAASITIYGENQTELTENPWRQTTVEAQALADDLLARLKDPHPVLQGVRVVGDPRIQLVDRVTLREPSRTNFVRDYWVVGITNTYSEDGGFEQALTLRDAGAATLADV